MPLQKLLLKKGDTLPVPFAILTDTIGQPLNLGNPGTVVRFRMVDYHTKQLVVDEQATVLQNSMNPGTFGQVTYYWKPEDTAREGLYQAWFIVNIGGGPQHFPPDDSYFVKIRPTF